MSTTTTSIASTNRPRYVTFDSSGNLFVSNYLDNTITKFVLNEDGTVNSSTIFSDINIIAPMGIAFNSQGDLFVVNSEARTFTRIKFSENGSVLSSQVFYVESLIRPIDLAFNSQDELFISSYYNSWITKVTFKGDGTINTNNVIVSSNLNHPYGITFNVNGDLFVANNASGTINQIKFNENGSVASNNVIVSGLRTNPTLSFGEGGINGLAFNLDGELFVSNRLIPAQITKITFEEDGSVATVTEYFITSPLIDGPIGLAFNSQNVLFLANYSNQTITKTVILKENTIYVAPEFDKTFGNVPFNINATSTNTNYDLEQLQYSTSDDSVAIVNSDGLVTLVSPGHATIIIEQAEGSGYAYAVAYTEIIVRPSVINNPTVLTNQYEFDYFMDTTAEYAQLTIDVQLTSELIAYTEKTLLSNGTIVNIVKVEPG